MSSNLNGQLPSSQETTTDNLCRLCLKDCGSKDQAVLHELVEVHCSECDCCLNVTEWDIQKTRVCSPCLKYMEDKDE